ncbi:hypothetical protein HDU93_000372 [Gonapodya sp. JEL0774]|nr:hypothetical protein HDU93_000372 [Gonapodya sp. JEL0774]
MRHSQTGHLQLPTLSFEGHEAQDGKLNVFPPRAPSLEPSSPLSPSSPSSSHRAIAPATRGSSRNFEDFFIAPTPDPEKSANGPGSHNRTEDDGDRSADESVEQSPVGKGRVLKFTQEGRSDGVSGVALASIGNEARKGSGLFLATDFGAIPANASTFTPPGSPRPNGAPNGPSPVASFNPGPDNTSVPGPPSAATQPAGKRKYFSEAEDLLIDRLYAEHGSDWDRIAREMGTERTGDQVRARYRRVQQRRKKEGDAGSVAALANGITGPVSGSVSGITNGGFKAAGLISVGLSPHQNMDEMTVQGRQLSPAPMFVPASPSNSQPSMIKRAPSPTPLGVPAPSSAPPVPPLPGTKPIYEYFTRPGDRERSEKEREKAIQEAVIATEERYRTKISNFERRVKELETERNDAEQLAVRVSREARDKIAHSDQERRDWKDKCWSVLSELLVTQARDKARSSRRKMHENTLRLASMTMERHGIDFREHWEQGYEFSAISDQLARINKEREEIDKKKKVLAKRKAIGHKVLSESNSLVPSGNSMDLFGAADALAAPKGRSASSIVSSSLADPQLNPISIAEFHEYDEILKIRLSALKKEEADLLNQQERLSVERDQHVRELRRIRDEDASRFNNHPVLHDRYLLLELLGRGGFSEVWKAFDAEEMRVVAVKQWSDERKKTYTRHAMREYSIHQRLSHPRIVRLFDVFEIDDQSFATVLEYCNGTDLESHLHSVKVLPEREARSVITQVFSGLKYLNEISPAVIHYDLKPGNILFHFGEVRITDFGLSKVVEPDRIESSSASERRVMGPPPPVTKWAKEIELTSQGAGTIWYLPPEVFENSRSGDAPRISSKVDVWSMGIIFYELLFGVKPFGRDQSQQTILRNDSITNEAHSLVFPAKPSVSQETKVRSAAATPFSTHKSPLVDD